MTGFLVVGPAVNTYLAKRVFWNSSPNLKSKLHVLALNVSRDPTSKGKTWQHAAPNNHIPYQRANAPQKGHLKFYAAKSSVADKNCD